MLEEVLWWFPSLLWLPGFLVLWFSVAPSSPPNSATMPAVTEGDGEDTSTARDLGPLPLTGAKTEDDPLSEAMEEIWNDEPADAANNARDDLVSVPAECLPRSSLVEAATTGNALPMKRCGSGGKSSGPVKTVRFALDLLEEPKDEDETEDAEDDESDEDDTEDSTSEDEQDFSCNSYQVNEVFDENDDDDDDIDEVDFRSSEGRTEFNLEYQDDSPDYSNVSFLSPPRVTSPISDIVYSQLGTSAPSPVAPSSPSLTFSTFGKSSPRLDADALLPPEEFRDLSALRGEDRPPPPPPKAAPCTPPALPPKKLKPVGVKRPVPLPRGTSVASSALPPQLPPKSAKILTPAVESSKNTTQVEEAAGVRTARISTGGPRCTPARCSPARGRKVQPRPVRPPRVAGVAPKGKENEAIRVKVPGPARRQEQQRQQQQQSQLKLKELIARFDACYAKAHADALAKRASSTDSGIDVSPDVEKTDLPEITSTISQHNNVTLIHLTDDQKIEHREDSTINTAYVSPMGFDDPVLSSDVSSDESASKCDSVLLAHSGPSSWEDRELSLVPNPPPPPEKPAGQAAGQADSDAHLVERLVSFYQSSTSDKDDTKPTTSECPKLTPAMGRVVGAKTDSLVKEVISKLNDIGTEKPAELDYVQWKNEKNRKEVCDKSDGATVVEVTAEPPGEEVRPKRKTWDQQPPLSVVEIAKQRFENVAGGDSEAASKCSRWSELEALQLRMQRRPWRQQIEERKSDEKKPLVRKRSLDRLVYRADPDLEADQDADNPSGSAGAAAMVLGPLYRRAVSDLTDGDLRGLERLEQRLSTHRYRTEVEIFFRAGVLEQLEAQRDERLAGHVARLQARCRGFLARRRLAKLKVQDLAVRCIQRNVRKFMSVRDWPWWRLLVRVTPLLNVHRTEEELRTKSEELEMLRVKVEKLEAERSQLKHDSDRLEAKLSEMTVDLAEEHSTASIATDRLEVEVTDRLRLEKELQDVQGQNKRLQQATERLELELLYARTADLNGLHSEDEEGGGEEGGGGDGASAALRQRYERTLRELEFTKRRLQQQHEDDLEQLVGLKKQLEKKLADAYEEVEEQRQVVGQWKRKVQKLSAETSDLRLLLENQSSRNNLLEKKQRKFDSELQLAQDELRGERQQRERLSREKEIALGEKYSMEQNLSALRLELELKEEKVASLSRELDELTFGGKTEEEVALLKKAKHQLEHKAKEQEEELDDLAGQVQLLEQAKLRLEMSLEQLRKENRKEIAQRDDELEDVRSNAYKKVKALEAQLENEHEERTQLVREKHELERRLGNMEEEWRTRRSQDDGLVQRLRRDLRRTRALLNDAQSQLERAKADTPGKAALRGLRNQLEDLEFARAQAVKARQMAESELTEVQTALEESQRLRNESEERANAANRERTELRTQLEENEEELAEVMKKYRAAVQQLSSEQAALQDSVARVAELEAEKSSLSEQLSELTARLASAETLGDPSSSLTAKRLELRTKELESRLELEQTTRSRMETQISRLKETVDKLQSETSFCRAREQSAQDTARKLQRSLRELREENSGLAAREAETTEKRKALEKRLEAAEADASSARADLKVALQRIDDLQQAIQGELELDDSSASDNSDNDNDSEGSDESIETFLANHNMGSGRLSTAHSSKRSSFCERSPRQDRNSMFDLSSRLADVSSPSKEDSS